jgi:hypothetical protein
LSLSGGPHFDDNTGSPQDANAEDAATTSCHTSPGGHHVATLTAKVVAGRKLKAMDRNGFSDPYMVLQVGSLAVYLSRSRLRSRFASAQAEPLSALLFRLSRSSVVVYLVQYLTQSAA